MTTSRQATTEAVEGLAHDGDDQRPLRVDELHHHAGAEAQARYRTVLQAQQTKPSSSIAWRIEAGFSVGSERVSARKSKPNQCSATHSRLPSFTRLEQAAHEVNGQNPTNMPASANVGTAVHPACTTHVTLFGPGVTNRWRGRLWMNSASVSTMDIHANLPSDASSDRGSIRDRQAPERKGVVRNVR